MQGLHRPLMDTFREFLVVGGMPEIVARFAEGRPWSEIEALKGGLLQTYRDDFGKYGRRVDPERLRAVFTRLPGLVGARFKYAHVDRNSRSGDVKRALDLLCRARVATRVPHTSAGGLPLAAQQRDTVFKVLFLDVGLVCASLGLRLDDVARARDVMLVNAGSLAEQAVGQLLLHSQPAWHEPELHFWSREKASSAAEVDYVLAEGTRIVPVEVKAGSTGTLKSLHLFLREKGLPIGLRFHAAPPSLLDTTSALAGGSPHPFRLLSLPLYLVGQARRLIRSLT